MDAPVYTTSDRFRIRLRRAARVLGLEFAREYYCRIRGRFFFRIPDPLEANSLMGSILERYPPDDPFSIEIAENNFEKFLVPKVTQAPGYKASTCYMRLVKLGETEWFIGSRRAYFLFRSDGSRVRVVLMHRTDSEPQLSYEQTRAMIDRIKKLRTIDPAAIAALKREILELGGREAPHHSSTSR